MPAAETRDEEPLPGSSMSPRQVRILKILVIAMGIALVGGFALVVGTIVYQASQLGKTDPASQGTAPASNVGPAVDAAGLRRLLSADGDVPFLEQAIPPGSRLAATTMDGTRLAVTLEDARGSSVLVVDMDEWRLDGILRLSRQPPATD